jgi:carbonic anhydrase
MDYRLHEKLHSFIAANGLDRDGVDIVRVAGVAKNLARPSDSSERDFVLQQLRTSVTLHGIKEIYLINHEGCGAYGLERVPDSDEELMIHSKDLRAARTLIKENFPEIDVRVYFMWLNGEANPVD